MGLQSPNGHHELPTLYSRRKKPSPTSRPFPAGFTPVIQISPCAQKSMNQFGSDPIFLPPALQSPLPPSDGNLTCEKEQARPNRLTKSPPVLRPPQRTPSKLIPSIRRICSVTRPSRHSPGRSVSDSVPASPAGGDLDSTVLHTGRSVSNPVTTRLRSLSQHSYGRGKPKLCSSKPSPSPEISNKKLGESGNQLTLSQVSPKAKPALTRIRSMSARLSTLPVERCALPISESCPKEKAGNHANILGDAWPDLSCARRSTKKLPSPPIKQVKNASTSCLQFNFDDNDETETIEEEDLKKLPDYILDNWTGWRMEILSPSCNSLPCDKPTLSNKLS
ncbi:hypothetical protein PCANC_22000 [Puccinia coronata f. sp. avenae]|uniref:Uncharacterized protein n=1 Tax=Puccinia coronata f. sp. avenae TaxID=200324 RepID=A0A2N5SFA7_9BASI|nr:hypothetical protein PCANC_22000 [Puccinia coronata f. sp. avenae]